MSFIIYLLLAATISFSSWALTLSDVRDLAVQNSSALKSKELESMALGSEKNLRGKWQNPQLMGQVGSLKSAGQVGSTIEFSLVQAVPLSDKFGLRRELAELALQSYEKEKKYFTQWVEHEALLASWRLLVARELYSHGIERAERIKLIQKYLLTHPRVSIRQKVEQSIIGSLVLQLQKMQDQKKHDLFQAEKELSYWIGREIKADEIAFQFPDEKKVFIPVEDKTIEDIELILAKNQLDISKIDAEIAKKERRPDLFIGAGYRVENVIPQNQFSYGIIGLNIPIWDTGALRGEATRARVKRDEKILEESQKKVSLKHQKQLEMVHYFLSQVRRFPNRLLSEQEKSIQQAEIGFKQGLIDVNTFLLSETQTHDVIDQIYLSWMGYLENLSTLQLMRSEKFEWETK
jgi:Outer membrane efflux protein